MSRYRFIAAGRGHYPGRRLCQVLGVGAATPAGEAALVKAFRHHKRR